MTQTQTQTEPKKPEAKKGPALDEYVFILHSPDEHESRLAQAWKQKLLASNPEATPRFMSELRLARLTERHIVIALYVPEGSQEITAGQPVRVSEHWISNGDDGEVNTRSFVGALGMTCLPSIVKLRKDKPEDVGVIRLGCA